MEKHIFFHQFRHFLLFRSSVSPLSEKQEIHKNIKHFKPSSQIASNKRAGTKRNPNNDGSGNRSDNYAQNLMKICIKNKITADKLVQEKNKLD